MNLRLSLLSTRLPYTIFAHNATHYDNLILLRGLNKLSNHSFKQMDRFGNWVSTKLFRTPPKVFFQSTETILSIQVRFNCRDLAGCEKCSLTGEEILAKKQQLGRLPACPSDRSIRFQDSLKHISFPLGRLIDDCLKTANIENIPLEKMFPTSHRFLTKQQHYNNTQFSLAISSKLSMPFERISGVKYLHEMRELPPKEHFDSKLRESVGINDADYALLKKIWKALHISSLFELFRIYLCLDSCLLADVISYYFDEIYKITSMDPR